MTAKRRSRPQAPGKRERTEKPGPGRPEGSYERPFDQGDYEEIKALAGYGLTETAIAAVKGMHERTFRRRKAADPALVSALSEGKALAEANVGKALYQLATGIRVRRVKRGPDGQPLRDPATGEEVREEVYTRVPDIKAIRWWEMTRAGRREQSDRVISGPGGGPIQTEDVSQMTPAQKVARFMDVVRTAKEAAPPTNGNGRHKP